ncbi:MAG: MarC family protein, partial [Spirochaetes bacterium]|nr:MarC family protein [Spirochaetota bacterium]
MNYMEIIILLFIVIDPFGNMPFVLALLQSCNGKKYQLIIARELLISFVILLVFFWQGDRILEVLNIEKGSLNIAGGVVLFIISLKMIFGNSRDLVSTECKDDPLIVPIAIPSIAGPSAITVMMFLKSHSKL